ncbi:MAG TPA: hypothetical protein VK458_16715 [Myxococcaceae bacterium]|nr:hypothetical protein [Myxococcaceae bacterium]
MPFSHPKRSPRRVHPKWWTLLLVGLVLLVVVRWLDACVSRARVLP